MPAEVEKEVFWKLVAMDRERIIKSMEQDIADRESLLITAGKRIAALETDLKDCIKRLDEDTGTMNMARDAWLKKALEARSVLCRMNTNYGFQNDALDVSGGTVIDSPRDEDRAGKSSLAPPSTSSDGGDAAKQKTSKIWGRLSLLASVVRRCDRAPW